MYAVIDINNFEKNNVYYCSPVNNTIMNDSSFIRTIYSTDYFIMNNIYIFFKLNELNIDKYFSKYKCNFNPKSNLIVIQQLKDIEKSILNRFHGKKTPIYMICEQLNESVIRIYSENENINTAGHFILKISGIWETNNEYGITFKFIDARH